MKVKIISLVWKQVSNLYITPTIVVFKYYGYRGDYKYNLRYNILIAWLLWGIGFDFKAKKIEDYEKKIRKNE